MSEEEQIIQDMLHIICEYGEDFEELENNEIRYQLPYTKMEKLYNYIQNKDKEIERLNNIINELEKWLDNRQNSSVFYEEYENADVYGIVLDKLQELKGSDKE